MPDPTITVHGIPIDGPPIIPGVSPSDGTENLFCYRTKAYSVSDAYSDVVALFALDNTVVLGPGATKQYTVATMPYMYCGPGASAGYGINPVYRTAGPSGCGGEINVDNLSSVGFGDGRNQDSVYDPLIPWATGLNLISAGAKPLTAALQIETPPGHGDLWNRGFNCAGGVVWAAFNDNSNAFVSMRIRGAHTHGIDASEASISGSAFYMANGAKISWRDNVGARLDVLEFNAANQFLIGYGVSNGISFGARIAPGADNAFSNGNASFRWSSVWATNGVIQTSDPSLKVVSGELPADVAEKIVRAVPAKTFRWRVGGNEAREIETPGTVQVLDERGHPILEPEPDLDENGREQWVQPVNSMTRKPPTSEPNRPQTSTEPVLKTVLKPRMQPGMVKQTIYEPREGRRTHVGAMADEVKAAFDHAGVDFGAYVMGEDGVHSLRPDQLMWILWQFTRSMDLRLQALESAQG